MLCVRDEVADASESASDNWLPLLRASTRLRTEELRRTAYLDVGVESFLVGIDSDLFGWLRPVAEARLEKEDPRELDFFR